MPDGSQELYEFKTRIPKFFRTDAGIQTKEVKPNCRRLLKEMFKPGINGKVSPPFPFKCPLYWPASIILFRLR